MWPAPCSWRTRMWRIDESMIGSYAGRMQPPGSPNMTSTPSISRLLLRACAPASLIVARFLFADPWRNTGTASRLGGRGTREVMGACLRDDYEEVGGAAVGH